ncbi:MAG: phosphate signaling complex protein PhoU [Pseudomonadota bacterium]
MIRHFDSDLNSLKDLLLTMGGKVEKALAVLDSSLVDSDMKSLQQVREFEADINRLHLQVDESSLLLLATQAPVATDLRLVQSVVKINTDLERMGDLIVNVASCAERYLRFTLKVLPPQWSQMMEQVRWMVSHSLDAFVKLDPTMSQQVLDNDDIVDSHNVDLTGVFKERMKSESIEIDAGVEALAMVKSLERLADHSTNIAEEVIFIVTGDDIRHGRRLSV